MDAAGHVFVADRSVNSRIRRIDAATSIVTTVAGGGAVIADSGVATNLNLGTVNDLALASADTLLVAAAARVWRVNLAAGTIAAYAGTGVAGFGGGVTPAPDGGAILSDTGNNRIRSITNALVGPVDLSIEESTPQSLLDGITNVEGSVIATNLDGTVSFIMTNLTTVGGNVVICDNSSLTNLAMPVLADVGDSLTIKSNLALGIIIFPGLTNVGGDVTIVSNNAATTIDLGTASVGGDVTVANNASATSIDLGTASVGGDVTITNNNAATTIDLGTASVGGSVTISNNPSLNELDLPALTNVVGTLAVQSNPALGTMTMQSLANVNDDVIITGNGGAGAVDLSGLGSVGGSVIVTGNGGAGSVNLSGLTNAGGDVIVTGNGGASSVDLSGLGSAGGDVIVTDNGGAIVLLGGASVSGDVIIETSGGGAVDLSGLNVTGSTTVTTSATNVTATTGGGSTTIQQASAAGTSTLTIPLGAFAVPTTFSAVVLGNTGSAAGTNAQSVPAAIDPLTSTEYTVPAPLGVPAAIEFDLTLALLDAATRSNVLAGLAEGRLTVARKPSGGAYAALSACGAGETATNGCAEVTPRDAGGAPIPAGSMEVPATISFRVLTTTFSTWAPALVYAFDPPQMDSIALAGTNLVITVDPRGNLAGLQANAVTVVLDESMDLVNWSRAGIAPRLENGRLIFEPVPGITNLFYRVSVTASGN